MKCAFKTAKWKRAPKVAFRHCCCDSWTWKMLVWTRVLLDGVGAFNFFPHFYFPFSVWPALLYFYTTWSIYFHFIFIKLWQFMHPESLTPSCTSQGFLTLLIGSVGISWHRLLHLASSPFLFFINFSLSFLFEEQLYVNWCLVLRNA